MRKLMRCIHTLLLLFAAVLYLLGAATAAVAVTLHIQSFFRIGLLNKWRERNGPHATYRKLAQSLFDAGKIDALQVLCELLGAPHNNQPPEKKQQSGTGTPTFT